MKTNLCLWQYRAHFQENEKMFQKKICRENQNTYLNVQNIFFLRSCRLWDKVEKYGTARQATDDNIIRSSRVTCWITKAIDTY